MSACGARAIGPIIDMGTYIRIDIRKSMRACGAGAAGPIY